MILVTRQARSLNLYFHKKCLRCFCFTNKSLYNETIDFDIHVGHFAYLDQHAKDEPEPNFSEISPKHFNPFLEGNTKLEEKHQLEAQTNHRVLGTGK
ncbi:transmembrane emp24 domain-containing protein p24beta2-like [Magnolia sinica]|uniref:transmembrane emp24 domain-containing protein p24beta2-like n=1 Tax=Magnolia sinica TaxID=86752 RepID=UPI002659B16B|nr:transmembrane emp24 domain-containing protein p24beta2-like [Magnolia sinica]